MKCTKEMGNILESWGGIMAVTVLLILIVFALFTSSGPGKKISGNTGKMEWEDIQEQRQANPKKIIVKEGQKLVVF